MTTWIEVRQSVKVGDRVRFPDTWDIYPYCIVDAGTLGTVTEIDEDSPGHMVMVLPDDLAVRDILKEWDGAVQFYDLEDGDTSPIEVIDQVREIARLHVATLKSWLTADEWDEMRRRNALPDRGESICHSHDFCDANESLAAAFEQVTGREIDADNEADCALWNAAWAVAMPELTADPQSRIAGGTP